MSTEETKQEELNFRVDFCHHWLIEIRSLATLTMKHIDTIPPGQKLPENAEYREILHVLLSSISVAAERIDEAAECLVVPTIRGR